MTAERYNGWTNYETWCVNLWIENDQGDSCYWQERIADELTDWEDSEDKDELRDEVIGNLSTQLEEYINSEQMPEVHGVYADLLTTALQAVDWDEIVTAWVDDYLWDEYRYKVPAIA
jgi:uncharacterized membrane protein YheB (UPF0754 family)